MDFCSINPKGTWEWMYEMPRVMLLTHLVEKYPEYVRLANNHPRTYKILDNSLIELGGALSMERLIQAADAIGADEIILPDVFKDGKATIESTKEAIDWLKERNLLGRYKLMAVAHGNNKDEWKECFDILDEIPEIDVIGIPKVTSTWLEERNRKNLFDVFKNSNKEIHFLGSWFNLDELCKLDKEVKVRVRSVDTCLPSLYAIQGKDFHEDREGTIDLEHEYKELTKEKYDNVINGFLKEFLEENV